MVQAEQVHPDAQPEGQDDPDRGVALALAYAEHADRGGDHDASRASAPATGSPTTSRPAAAPVKESSAVPCTAKAISRVTTNGPISPLVIGDQRAGDQRVLRERLPR